MAGTRHTTAAWWPAAATAVGLLTRHQRCPDVDRAVVLGDCPPGDALEAMEVIASAFAAALSPDDDGARLLEFIGLRVLEHAAREPE